ncbi:MAG: hypothetical protein GY866_09625 [Proteobacteria bacterium]|nr:hypothetical protein [Pseudomonadota bacterium]
MKATPKSRWRASTYKKIKEELKSALFNLQGLEFIYEKQLFPELEYIFKHALIQEVAYSSLLQKRRREIHEHIGKTIEEIYADKLEEFYEVLAHHYVKAENDEKALFYLSHTHGKAYRNDAHAELLSISRQYLKVISKQPETDLIKRDKIGKYEIMWEAYTNLAFTEDTLRILQDGIRLAKEIDDEWYDSKIIDFSSFINTYYVNERKPELGIKYLEDTLKEMTESGDTTKIAAITLNLAYYYTYDKIQEVEKAIATTKTAINMVEKDDKTLSLGGYYTELCGRYAFLTSLIGRFREAEDCCAKSLQNALPTDSQYGLKNAADFYYGRVLLNKGAGKQALDHIQNNIKYMEEIQYLQTIESWSNIGWGHYLLGDFNTALALFDGALRMQNESNNPALFFLNNYRLSRIHQFTGDLQTAMTHAEAIIQISENQEEIVYSGFRGVARVLYGLLLAKLDSAQFDEAEGLMLDGTKLLEELAVKPDIARAYQSLGDFYLTVGESEEALNYLSKAEEQFNEMDMQFYLGRNQEIKSRVFNQNGDIPKAKEHLTKAIDNMNELEANGWVEKFEKELSEMA